ncbi:MAG: 3-deoxy-manno-octulosonate cytidylyltransferase [Paracoccaceae bacterium]
MIKKDFIVVIPARISSGRLARKPLADICGKPMILHTYERALEATDPENIFIATDTEEIMRVCQKVGANSVLTSKSCKTGTDRIAELSKIIKAKSYINLQGDEPLMDPKNIEKMIASSIKHPDKIINGWAKIQTKKEYFSRTIPKVVLKNNDSLMYMSRSPIPGNKKNEFINAKKQICVYSFPYSALEFMIKNPFKAPVEDIEDIEILRFLEQGWYIKMIELYGNSIAVDTPSDLQRVRKKMTQIITRQNKTYQTMESINNQALELENV